MIRNLALRDAMLALGERALEHLAPQLRHLNLPLDSPERGIAAINIVYDADLSNLPEWRKVEGLLGNDPGLARHFDALVGIPGWRARISIPKLLSKYIHNLVLYGHSLDHNDFASLYQRFERFLYDPVLPLEVTVPVLGLAVECESLQVGQATLRMYEPEPAFVRAQEYAELFMSTAAFPWGEIHFTFQAPRLLAGDDVPPSSGPYDANVITRRVSNVVAALRILKPGRFVPLWIERRVDAWGSPLGTVRHPLGPVDTTVWPKTYQLRLHEEPVLQGLCRAMENVPGSIATSIHWFSKAVEERDEVDKLIALMIAAEAFFLDDSNHGELRYRFAQRLAVYLGDTFNSRVELQRFGRHVYDVRSQLVHGALPKSPKVQARIDGEDIRTLGRLAEQLERLMRQSLRKTLNSTQHQPSQALWDRLVLGGDDAASDPSARCRS